MLYSYSDTLSLFLTHDSLISVLIYVYVCLVEMQQYQWYHCQNILPDLTLYMSNTVVSFKKQELLIVLERMSSYLVFGGVSVALLFSFLSCVLIFVSVLYLVYSILPVCLDSPLLIAHSVPKYHPGEKHAKHYTTDAVYWRGKLTTHHKSLTMPANKAVSSKYRSSME